MKIVLSFCIILLWSINSFCQTSSIAFNNPDSLTGLNDYRKICKAHIKTCKVEEFWDGNRPGSFFNIYKFRVDGKLSDILVYESNELPIYEINHIKYVYDSIGNLIEKGWVKQDSIFKVDKIYVYEKNNLINSFRMQYTEYGDDKILEDSTLYKKNGLKTKRFVYGAGGESIIIYNKRGKPIKTINHHRNGKPYYKSINKYDDNNNLVKEISLWLDGNLENKKIIRIIKNDSVGRTIQLDILKNNTRNISRTYLYDSFGNMIEENKWSNNYISSKIIFFYDNNGLITCEEKYEGEAITKTTMGLSTVQIVYSQDCNLSLKVRKIYTYEYN